MSEFSAPEIISADLASVVLVLSAWGCQSVDEMLSLPFIDAPPGREGQARAGRARVARGGYWRQFDDGLRTNHRRHATGAAPGAVAVAKATDLPSALRVAALLDEDTAKGGDVDLAKRPLDVRAVGRLAKRLGKKAEGTGDALGAALAVGFRDLIAQRRGDASLRRHGLSAGQWQDGASRRPDGPEFLWSRTRGPATTGQCRIYAYATVTRDELEPYVSSSRRVFAVPSQGYAVRARGVPRLLVPSSSIRRRPRSRSLKRQWSFSSRRSATSAASARL